MLFKITSELVLSVLLAQVGKNLKGCLEGASQVPGAGNSELITHSPVCSAVSLRLKTILQDAN